MKLIVGLGNPGKEYEKTRHNMGFRVCDLLAGKLLTSFDRTKFKGEYASASLDDAKGERHEILLVKPQTYEPSGEPVLGFSGFYKIPLENPGGLRRWPAGERCAGRRTADRGLKKAAPGRPANPRLRSGAGGTRTRACRLGRACSAGSWLKRKF
jgi:hypothetical protein